MIPTLWHAIHPLVDVLGVWFLAAIVTAILWAVWRSGARAVRP